MVHSSRRSVALGLGGLLGLAACGGPRQDPNTPPSRTDHRALLAWAIGGRWRIDPERDMWRHPTETLTFWGLRPGMTVLELFPGQGWLTCILAPYLAASGGRLIVAHPPIDPSNAAQSVVDEAFVQRFGSEPDLFGAIEQLALTADDIPLALPDTIDLAICARNVHTLMALGMAEIAFAKVFAALKPQGVLGIEQHRGSSAGVQDPAAANGYVQEAFVKTLVQGAGFAFVGSTDVNANPRDTRDHPFGVWTLPPVLRSAPIGQPDDPDFDRQTYVAIGESDRMTLKFNKPGVAQPATAEEETKGG
ncbi:MAG: class I SAM-dependent methyltransferase [Caulobacterales bacterium]